MIYLLDSVGISLAAMVVCMLVIVLYLWWMGTFEHLLELPAGSESLASHSENGDVEPLVEHYAGARGKVLGPRSVCTFGSTRQTYDAGCQRMQGRGLRENIRVWHVTTGGIGGGLRYNSRS